MTAEANPKTILDRLKAGEKVSDEEIRARFQELQSGVEGISVEFDEQEEFSGGSYIWPPIERKSGFK